jgi:serine/threonine-protein kinase
MAVDTGQRSAEEKDFPETLGRYRLIRRISTGGMAHVYEARRESLAGVAPRVAIKVILPEHAQDLNFQKLFVNEARIGSQLQHPNLVQIQDFDREKDCYYLVMEYVEGPTLRRVLSLSKRNGLGIPMEVIAEVGRQMLEGLNYAHTAIDEDGTARRLVHRDIKPGNIILNPQGVVKVLDFGISKALTGQEAGDGVKGTWGYMSPEQSRAAPVSGAADQWGVGCVLFELACLHRIFSERDPVVIRERMEKDDAARQASTLSGPYRDLGPILVRALQRDPMARYSSALEFSRALAKLVPDPIVTRDALIDFQKKISTLEATRLSGGDLVRSHSTLSRVPSSKSMHSGIPVAVGNVHRARSAAEIHPAAHRSAADSRKSRTAKGPGTVYLAFVGAALCVLVFTVLQIVSGEPTTSESTPEVQIRSRTEDIRVPARAPVIVQPPKQALDLPVVKPKVIAPAPPRPKPAVVKKSGPVATPVIVPQKPLQPVVAETGLVSISSWPKARVYVDGVYLQDSPLNRHALPVGAHTVRLVTDDGRTHQFAVEAVQDRTVRKIWHFDENAWIESVD